jgi:hypothetical protein
MKRLAQSKVAWRTRPIVASGNGRFCNLRRITETTVGRDKSRVLHGAVPDATA